MQTLHVIIILTNQQGGNKMKIKDQTFENYLNASEHLTFEDMTLIHKLILDNANITNEDFKDVWEDVIQSSIDYSNIRSKWSLFTIEEKMDKDPLRTSLHDDVIFNFIILERIFKMNQWDSKSWTEILFLESDVSTRHKDDLHKHRKRIGDFSNYLSFIYALTGR